MKRFLIISILAVITAGGTTILAQDQPDEYLGLPGDNFNLYAVMNLFQQSETIEGFERSLNDESTRINNLDLNGDNLIDYIKVIDYVNGNDHTIVLRAVLGRNETQDVAVFTIQKFGDGSVQIQLTGDEVLYGRNYIIEPIYAETPNPGYTRYSNRYNGTVYSTTYYEVAAWPLVRFIFLPNYLTWCSSWYWGYYPNYWHPWRPYYWHYYYGYHYNWYPHYYQHYHHCDYHRYAHWDDFYYHGHRAHSHYVDMRINAGHYQATYSHPEQRKEGEALYSRSHPERASSLSSGNNQGRRTDSRYTASSQPGGNANGTSRRSTSAAPDRSVNNTTTAQGATSQRRSTQTATERKVENQSSGQSTGAARRTSPTVNDKARTSSTSKQNTGNVSGSGSSTTNKARTNPQASQNTGNVSRSGSPSKDKARTISSSNHSTGNVSRSNYSANLNNGNSRRSPEVMNSRSASRPESGQRTESARTLRQPSTSVSSSSHKSSQSSKSQSTSKSSSKSKEPESSSTSRRK
jgi:hypothetical protein